MPGKVAGSAIIIQMHPRNPITLLITGIRFKHQTNHWCSRKNGKGNRRFSCPVGIWQGRHNNTAGSCIKVFLIRQLIIRAFLQNCPIHIHKNLWIQEFPGKKYRFFGCQCDICNANGQGLKFTSKHRQNTGISGII